MVSPNEDRPEIQIRTNAPIRATYDTTMQDLLITTTSNARDALYREWERIRPRNDWTTPLGIFVAVVLSIMTTDFVERFGVSADSWTAGFWIVAVSCFMWTIVKVVRRVRLGSGLTPSDVVKLLMDYDGGQPLKRDAVAPQSSESGPERNGDQSTKAGKRVSQLVFSARPEVRTTKQNAEEFDRSDSVAAPDLHMDRFPPRSRVKHPNFGPGSVVETVRKNQTWFIRVRFDDPDVRSKELREDLAPLEAEDV